MARLGDHPHVVTVYDVFEDAGSCTSSPATWRAARSPPARAPRPRGRLPVARGAAHRAQRSPTRSRTRTRTASCTATSSPTTSGSPPTAAAGARRLRHRRWRCGDPRVGRHGDRHAVLPAARAGGGRRRRRPARTSTRSARRCGSCSAGGRRSPAPTRRRCSPQHRYAGARAAVAPRAGASRPRSTRWCSRLLAKRPEDRPGGAAEVRDALDRARRRPAARPSPPWPPTASRSSAATRELAPPARRARRGRARAAPASSRWPASPGSARRGSSTRSPPRPAPAARRRPRPRGRGVARLRARGAPRCAPLVAAASGLPADVLDDVRRLTGDGRPPEARGAAARDGEEERLRMFDAVAAAGPRGRAPRRSFVALEDLHDADRSSLALLAPRAAARRRTRALLVVLTYRAGRRRRRPPARRGARRARPRRAGSSAIALRGLAAAAVRRFCPRRRAARRRVRALHERTGGNPFFLRELVRLLAERGELAGDGRTLPRARPGPRARGRRPPAARRCEPATREVLAIAGVVGRPFTIAGVARVGGLGREEVAQALEPALAGRLVEARADAPGRLRLRPRDRARRGLRRAAARACARGCTRPSPRCCEESLAAGGEATAAEAAQHALAAARCGARPAGRAGPVARGGARGRGAAGARRGGGALRRRARGARAGRGGRAGGAPARRRWRSPPRRSPPATSRPRGAASARVAAAARRRGARRRAGARGARLLRGPALRRDRRRGDRAARRTRSTRCRPTTARCARARSARLGQRLDPVDRPGAPRGAGRRGRRDGAPARRRRRARPLLSAAALVNWPPERAAARGPRPRRSLALARAQRRPRRGLLGAHDAAARRARGRRARGRRRRARPPRAAGRGEPPPVLPLVPARPAGRRARPSRGRLDEGERLAEEAVALNRRHGDDADQEHTVQRLALALLRRRPAATRRSRALRDYAARYPRAAGVAGDARRRRSGRCGRATAARAASTACARDGFAALLRTPDWLCGLALLAEPVAALRHAATDVDAAGRRARSAARGPQRGHGRRLGGVRAGRARRSACSPRRPGARTRRRAHFARRRRARARAGARPAGSWRRSRDWLRSGSRAPSRRAARPRARARARARAAVGRRRLGGSDHDAVGLRSASRELASVATRVAAVAPVLAPAAAHEEARGVVADERGRVLERRRRGVERVERAAPGRRRTAVDVDHEQHGPVLVEPVAPVREPARAGRSVRVEPVVVPRSGAAPPARRSGRSRPGRARRPNGSVLLERCAVACAPRRARS